MALDRDTLYKVLDDSFIEGCDLYQKYENESPNVEGCKDEKGMYKLANYDRLLSHYDERLSTKLNQKYVAQERKFAKEKHVIRQMPKDVPPVDPGVRKRQVKYHERGYKPLRTEVGSSQKRLSKAKAGAVRERPISAPDLMMYHYADQYGQDGDNANSRPMSVMEMAGHLIRLSPGGSSKHRKQDSLMDHFPRWSPSGQWMEHQHASIKRPKTVSDDDIFNTQLGMRALMFDMETLETKHEEWLHEDMDFLLPGYRDKLEAKRNAIVPKPPPTRAKKESIPSPESTNRLAYPFYKGPPPAHGRSCDARFRGWQKVSSKKGKHYVLDKPAFDHSPTGALLEKLQKHTQDQVPRDNYIHRYTKRKQVVPVTQRPYTAPNRLQDQFQTMSEFYEIKQSLADDKNKDADSEKQTMTSEVSARESETGGKSSDITSESSGVSWADLQMYHDDEDSHLPDSDKKTPVSDPKESPPFQTDGEKRSSIDLSKTGKPLDMMLEPKTKIVELSKVGRVAVLEQIEEMEDEKDETMEDDDEDETDKDTRTRNYPDDSDDDMEDDADTESEGSDDAESDDSDSREKAWPVLPKAKEHPATKTVMFAVTETRSCSSAPSSRSGRSEVMGIVTKNNTTVGKHGVPETYVLPFHKDTKYDELKDNNINLHNLPLLRDFGEKKMYDFSKYERHKPLMRMAKRGKGLISVDTRTKLIKGVT